MKLAAVFLMLFLAPVAAQAQEECPHRQVRIEGHSLEPLISHGDSVAVQSISCAGDIKKGALVIFRNGASKIPLIKRIHAVPEDSFSVANGLITVNGEILENSEGQIYTMPEGRLKMIALYARSYNNIIPSDTYLVLGEKVGGTTDSTRFGLVHRQDIIGVVKDVMQE